MITYIVQVMLFQALFLVIYDIFLQKETFFVSNRVYLLVTPLLSFTIPLLEFVALQKNIPTEYIIALPEVVVNPQVVIEKVSGSDKLLQGIGLFFVVGVLVFFGIFLFKIKKVYQLLKRNKIKKQEDYFLVVLKNSTRAFSFFSYIFIGEKLVSNKKAKIIQHELVHAKQYHTLDLLFFEVLKIIMWFNPFVYVYQKKITVLHEYISDAEVLKNSNKQQYFQQLLASTFSVENISFINQFYKHSLLKKRILMSTKSKSKKVNQFKYLVLLPLVASMLLYTSCGNEKGREEKLDKRPKKMEIITKKAKKNTTITKKVIEEGVPFTIIDKAPIFPGCNEFEEDLKKCFSKKIQEYIAKNFKTDIVENLNLSSGEKRIMVMFKVSKEGKITDVRARAPHELLQEEAIRVITSLPKMIPGKFKGNNVAVKYSLPITFKIE